MILSLSPLSSETVLKLIRQTRPIDADYRFLMYSLNLKSRSLRYHTRRHCSLLVWRKKVDSQRCFCQDDYIKGTISRSFLVAEQIFFGKK